jgi:hypothetical protein
MPYLVKSRAPGAEDADEGVPIGGSTDDTLAVWLLRYEFSDGSLLVNDGTLGTGYNLLEDEICEG